MATPESTEKYQIPEHERPVLAELESTLKKMVEMGIPYKAALMRVYLARLGLGCRQRATLKTKEMADLWHEECAQTH